jgi:hypothetical protein
MGELGYRAIVSGVARKVALVLGATVVSVALAACGGRDGDGNASAAGDARASAAAGANPGAGSNVGSGGGSDVAGSVFSNVIAMDVR